MSLVKIKDKESLDFYRKVSKEVVKGDDVKTITKEIFDVLYKNNAVGMASVMIGIHKRIIIVDLQENNKKSPLVLINPEIIEKSNEKINWKESSIILDNIEGEVERYKTIKVKYKDVNFNDKIIEADGLLSVCIQHQMDYIDGKLFIDYLENKNEIIKSIMGLKIKNVIYNLDVLRKKCEPVDKIDDEIKNILNNMLEVMYNEKGIGLTANQVGINKQLIVIDLQKDGVKEPLFLINPKIVKASEEMVVSEQEGCLSVPSARADVLRHERVSVEYLDIDGNKQIIDADGLLSICLQHEIDHSNGKLFIDYLSKLKQENLLKKVKKYLK